MHPNLHARIALVMAAIELQRKEGLLDYTEPVSYRRMERLSYQIGEPVSREQFARAEQKARLAALAIKARSSSSLKTEN